MRCPSPAAQMRREPSEMQMPWPRRSGSWEMSAVDLASDTVAHTANVSCVLEAEQGAARQSHSSSAVTRSKDARTGGSGAMHKVRYASTKGSHSKWLIFGSLTALPLAGFEQIHNSQPARQLAVRNSHSPVQRSNRSGALGTRAGEWALPATTGRPSTEPARGKSGNSGPVAEGAIRASRRANFLSRLTPSRAQAAGTNRCTGAAGRGVAAHT